MLRFNELDVKIESEEKNAKNRVLWSILYHRYLRKLLLRAHFFNKNNVKISAENYAVYAKPKGQ